MTRVYDIYVYMYMCVWQIDVVILNDGLLVLIWILMIV